MLHLEYLFHEASAGRRACKPERIVSGAALRTSSRPARRTYLGRRHSFQSGGCQPDGWLFLTPLGSRRLWSQRSGEFWCGRNSTVLDLAPNCICAYVRLLRAGDFSGRPRQRLTITAVRRPRHAGKTVWSFVLQQKIHSVQTVCTELFFDADLAMFDEAASLQFGHGLP